MHLPRTMVAVVTLLVAAWTAPGCDRSTDRDEKSAARPPVGEPVELDETRIVAGQTLYVPVYSHIYQRRQDRVFDLTITLSIRNTDPGRPIVLTSASYHDDHGALVREYLDRPLRIDPLGTYGIVVEQDDRSGGAGANFLVHWAATEPVNPPLVEAVMISTSGQQGLSFTSRGVPVESKR